MNPKIKELAEQAQRVVGHTDGGYTEIKALDQELFAKLIIDECIAVLDEKDGSEHHSCLLEHFGVDIE